MPEVPEKPVVEEKPAVPVPKKVESPPPEGTCKTINELATCAISNLSLVPLFFFLNLISFCHSLSFNYLSYFTILNWLQPQILF